MLISKSHWHHTSLDVWWLYIQRMERRGWMSESGHLSSILGTCWAYRSLNLSPSPEDWENLNIVYAPPSFCLLSQELLCDWAWLDRGKVCAYPGHKKHKNLSLCWEPCSCFSPDTLDLLHLDFRHSSPCPAHLHIPKLLTTVKLWLRKHMFMFPETALKHNHTSH